MEQYPKRVKRIVVYIPEDQHRQLRSKLALQGKTVAEWFREKTREFLNESK